MITITGYLYIDSLCYEINTEDVYKDMASLKTHLDTSKYEKSHPLFSEEFKQVPGRFKDEGEGMDIIREYLNYSFRLLNETYVLSIPYEVYTCKHVFISITVFIHFYE